MNFGDVAQLGERCPCKAEVVGSIPIVSSGTVVLSREDKIIVRNGKVEKQKSFSAAELTTRKGAARLPRSRFLAGRPEVVVIFDNLMKSKWHL